MTDTNKDKLDLQKQAAKLFLHVEQSLHRMSAKELELNLLRQFHRDECFDLEDSLGVENAITLAEDAHKNQIRKSAYIWGQKEVPYIVHPLRLANAFLTWYKIKAITEGYTLPQHTIAQMVVALLLHDTVEDSNGRVTLGHILKVWDQDVYHIVDKLTKPSKDDPQYKEKSARYFTDIASANELVRIAKCLDRIDNLLDSLRLANKPDANLKYLKETEEVYLPIVKSTDVILTEAMTWAYEVLKTKTEFGL